MTPTKWRQLYDRTAPALAIICLAASLFASVGVFWNDRVNGQQDRARLADQTALLGCFDTFATDLSGGLPPVREASVQRDDALAAALLALQDGLVKVGTETFTAADLATVIRLFDTYRRESENLTRVRAANPYPPPPSKFCNDAVLSAG